MSGELSSGVAYKPRSVLGDVTNQVVKRGFCSISKSDVKSGDDYKKDEGIQFGKKECRRVDNFKENNDKETVGCDLRAGSCPPGVRLNVSPTFSAVVDVVSDSSQHTQLVHTNDIIPLDENGPEVVVEAEDDEKTESADLAQIELKGKMKNKLGMDDVNDATLDNLDSSKDDYLDCSRFPESQESRLLESQESRLLESQESKCGLEQCVGQKGDGFSSECMDMIKACPCSFCMKAAELWSDLHYQDIKGRIAVIKKSQKEATILVNRNSRDVARVDKLSNLESDLTGRWKSLFLYMEDIFIREGTQLETSLSTLKEVMDNCKTDLEKH